MPFFFDPALDARVPVIDLPPELAARARGVEVDPQNPIFETYGENAWKSRVRAHPDVAERHHGIRRLNACGTGAFDVTRPELSEGPPLDEGCLRRLGLQTRAFAG